MKSTIIILTILIASNLTKMNAQQISINEIVGTWKFVSWKTLYSDFHPDMEPKEGSDKWNEIEINEENPTSEIMDAVFKSRTKFSRSSITLVNSVKSGPWLEANFKIENVNREGWWEYDEDEKIIAFLIDGYGYNLYFHLKELNENEMIVIEKLYKTESNAYFNYITMKRE